MHFCRFNLEFLGLGYKMSQNDHWNYSIETFELYSCTKCGKNIFKNVEVHSHIYRSTFVYCREDIENCGYRPLGELLRKYNKL